MNKRKSMSAEKLYKIFIYVVLATFAITIIVPVAWTFIASLKQNSEFYGSPWTLPESLNFQNYIDAFEKANMGEYFLNSIIATGLGLALLLVVAIPAAYAVSRFKFKGKKVLNLAFMAGLFININYIVVPIFLMLVDGNKGLKGLLEGMNVSQSSWLYQTFGQNFFLNNIVILAIIYAATALPFTIYLLSSYFQTLPKAYEEAAYVDGSGYFRTMIKVIVPMAKPSIITVLLFNFLAFWNEYIIAMTLMTGDSKTLPVGLMNLMKAQNAAAQYGQMYAGLVIVMLPTLILYIMVQKKLTEGMTAGGIKG